MVLNIFYPNASFLHTCLKWVKNFAKFTGKHPCRFLFFNKVVHLKPSTLLKKRHRRKKHLFSKYLRETASISDTISIKTNA